MLDNKQCIINQVSDTGCDEPLDNLMINNEK